MQTTTSLTRLALALALSSAPAWAQDEGDGHAHHDMEMAASVTDSRSDDSAAAAAATAAPASTMPPGAPLPPATPDTGAPGGGDAHAGHGGAGHAHGAALRGPVDTGQAQGLQSEPSPHDPATGRHESHGGDGFLWLRADQLEAFDAGDDSGQRWKAGASWGNSFDRVWLASEGERSDAAAPELDTRLFWSHAVAPFWNATLGLRETNGEGESRSWAGIGLQGLAPYWFETEVALYAGEGGQTALRVDLEYELLLSNRLILQPQVELNAYGRDDAARGEGAGLADGRAGLRLRYEFSRKVAPYVGVEWTQAWGGTRDLRDAAGERAHDTRAVAGLRLWY